MFLIPPHIVAYLAGVASMIIFGSQWYGPLLGSVWIVAVEKKRSDLRPDLMPRLLMSTILCNAIGGLVIANFVEHFKLLTIQDALPWLTLLWFGLWAAPVFSANGWAGRKLALFLIDAGCTLGIITLFTCIYLFLRSYFAL